MMKLLSVDIWRGWCKTKTDMGWYYYSYIITKYFLYRKEIYSNKILYFLSGVTERSDSRRKLTPGSFFYVEIWPPVNILQRKVTPFSVEFMALGSFFSV
jgi:hypothetical protein